MSSLARSRLRERDVAARKRSIQVERQPSTLFHCLNSPIRSGLEPSDQPGQHMCKLGLIFRLCVLLPAIFAATAAANAQNTDVRFVLDFLLQGQQSPFVLGRERGYYAAQKINLAAFDPGRGGADSITKVASGTHDLGFGDLSAMIEYNARNPGRELIAVLLIYDQAPLSIISLKKSGIEKPADLMGRRGGAPAVDATYRLFKVFARVNGLDPARVQWTNVQPQIREFGAQQLSLIRHPDALNRVRYPG